MLALWILGAFALGLLARQFRLPPMVGFLAAGFLLNGFGVEPAPAIEEIGHAGVWLLLFTVGLKLRFKSIIRPEVWVTALTHLAICGAVAGLLAMSFGGLGWQAAVLLGAAFGFSSTVLTVIVLEPKRELRAFHGRVAIGILIFQDLVAVALLALAAGTAPSAYALLLLPALLLLKPVLDKLLTVTGHGELLVLLGVVLAVAVGGYGFAALGISGELGALALGALLAGHPRAVELGDALWGMKEIFLVCFFLGIGLAGLPTLDALGGAALLMLVMPLKVLLFFVLLLVAGLRSRSSMLAALSLATYSEFGLIVIQLGVREGLLDPEWMSLAALAVAVSFVVASPLNRLAHNLYVRLAPFLQRVERRKRHPDDEPVSLGTAEVIVVGMGRVGSGAYRYLREQGLQVVGLDSDMGKVERHLREGRRVVYADAEDPELWHRVGLDRVRAVMLALPDAEAKMIASRQLRVRGFAGLIAATHVHDEEREPILASGCDVTFNYFAEAGTGFAAHISDALQAALSGGASSRP
jgi:predicted Kef-type K+ transport protein